MKISRGGRDGVVSSVSGILNREGGWRNEAIYWGATVTTFSMAGGAGLLSDQL